MIKGICINISIIADRKKLTQLIAIIALIPITPYNTPPNTGPAIFVRDATPATIPFAFIKCSLSTKRGVLD
ncbi:hypothetical protein CE91St50_06370 [Clostridioides difficile]|nr:hypothetical protein CE91St50_06370 [Clostridioides difficile]